MAAAAGVIPEVDKSTAIRSGAKAGDVPWLDGVRAIAVISIFLRHSWGLAGQPSVSLGPVSLDPFIVMMSNGVDLFFVLSAFLLSQRFFKDQLAGKRSNLRLYARRRFYRIYPPYWVVLFIVLAFLVPSVIKSESIFNGPGLLSVIAHVLCMQTVFPFSYGSYTVESPFWTLTIELCFYLVLPFVIRFFVGRLWWVSWITTLVISGVWLAGMRMLPNGFFGLYQDLPPGNWPVDGLRYELAHNLPTYAFTFACGIVAARIWVRTQHGYKGWWTSKTASRVYIGVGALVLLAWMYVLGRLTLRNQFYAGLPLIQENHLGAQVFYYLESAVFGLAFAAIVLGLALHDGQLKRVVSIRALAFFGVCGYGIYLLHMPLLYNANFYGLFRYWGPLEKWLGLIAVVGVMVSFAAYWFYRLVETPFIEKGRAAPAQREVTLPLDESNDSSGSNTSSQSLSAGAVS